MTPQDAHPAHPRHVVAVTGVVTDTDGWDLLGKGNEWGWEPPGGRVEAPQQREGLWDVLYGGDALSGGPGVRYRAYRTEPYEASMTSPA